MFVCKGGYVGLWSWLRRSVFSSSVKLRDRVTSDPRFDVLLPPPVRRVIHWVFRLDSKVVVTTAQCDFSCEIFFSFVFHCFFRFSFVSVFANFSVSVSCIFQFQFSLLFQLNH